MVEERRPELRQRRERQVRGDGERVPLDEPPGRGDVVRHDGAGRRTAAVVVAAVAIVVVPPLVPSVPPAEESGGVDGAGVRGIDRPVVPAVEQGHEFVGRRLGTYVHAGEVLAEEVIQKRGLGEEKKKGDRGEGEDEEGGGGGERAAV